MRRLFTSLGAAILFGGVAFSGGPPARAQQPAAVAAFHPVAPSAR